MCLIVSDYTFYIRFQLKELLPHIIIPLILYFVHIIGAMLIRTRITERYLLLRKVSVVQQNTVKINIKKPSDQ